MEQIMTVHNVCFNGHDWEKKQSVGMDTGVTDYEKCPACGELIQLQSIPEFSGS